MPITVYIFLWIYAGILGFLNMVMYRVVVEQDYPKKYKPVDFLPGFAFSLLLGPGTFIWLGYLLATKGFKDDKTSDRR